MAAYRTPPQPDPNPVVKFGLSGGARFRGVLGALLIAASAAMVVGWATSGGRISGSVLLPAILGLALLLRTREGAIEYVRATRELSITLRGPLRRKKVRVAVEGIMGVSIIPTADSSNKERELVLHLVQRGGRSVPLLRATREDRLEPARAAIGQFLLDHDLLEGPPPRVEPDRVRVEEVAAPRPSALGAEERQEDDLDGPRERTGRRSS